MRKSGPHPTQWHSDGPSVRWGVGVAKAKAWEGTNGLEVFPGEGVEGLLGWLVNVAAQGPDVGERKRQVDEFRDVRRGSGAEECGLGRERHCTGADTALVRIPQHQLLLLDHCKPQVANALHQADLWGWGPGPST
jgi:hypothetical protein